MNNFHLYVVAALALLWVVGIVLANMPAFTYKKQGGLRFVTFGRLSFSYSFRKGA